MTQALWWLVGLGFAFGLYRERRREKGFRFWVVGLFAAGLIVSVPQLGEAFRDLIEWACTDGGPRLWRYIQRQLPTL